MWLFFWFFYGIISAYLSHFFLWFLGTNKNFVHSFYRVVQCDLFFNLLTFYSTWVTRFCHLESTKLMMVGITRNNGFILAASAFCTHFFFHVQSLSTLTISLHRLSSSKWKLQFWKKSYLLVYLAIVIFSVSFVTAQYLNGLVPPLVFNETTETFGFSSLDMQQATLYGQIFLGASAIYFFCILTSGLAASLMLYKRCKGLVLSKQSKRVMRELNAVSLTHAVIYLIVLLWGIFTPSVFSKLGFAANSALMMSVSDLLSLSMPYILIIFDQRVKAGIRQKLTKLGVWHSGSSTPQQKLNRMWIRV